MSLILKRNVNFTEKFHFCYRLIFNANDEPLLNFLNEDNQRIEPYWYLPIIPMVLVNGAEGIGTGWSSKVPNYDPREIINVSEFDLTRFKKLYLQIQIFFQNLKRMINGLEPQSMQPWFKNFKGSIEQLEAQKYVINGEISELSETKLEITELPIRTWTQTYKENTIEPYLNGSEKVPAQITDYKEYVNFSNFFPQLYNTRYLNFTEDITNAFGL